VLAVASLGIDSAHQVLRRLAAMWTLEGISRDHCTNCMGRAVSEGRSVGEDGFAAFLARCFDILHLCQQELRGATYSYPDSSTATRESQSGVVQLRRGGMAVAQRPPTAVDAVILGRIGRRSDAGEHGVYRCPGT